MDPEADKDREDLDRMIAEIYQIIARHGSAGVDEDVLIHNIWGCLNFALFDAGWKAEELKDQIDDDYMYAVNVEGSA